MFKKIIKFYKTGPDKPPIKENIDKFYKQKRLSVFLTLTLGYGLFYICRLSFSVTKKPMIDEGIFNATELGMIGSAFFFVYAFGKLINGFLADHANIKKFLSTGLMVSAFINLFLGFNSAFWLFLILWGVNGWFQSMGSAPCVVSMSQWFSNRERGTRYGIWSTGHSIGEALTFVGTAFLVNNLGWRFGLWGPGLFCILVAILIYIFMSDRPKTYGLPEINQYKNDAQENIENKSLNSLQWSVIKNPYIWVLGLSSACMYVARYAINNWGILFLQEYKNYSLIQAGSILSAYPIMGILGAASSGIISDGLFKSKRNIPTLLFGVIQILSLVLFCFTPPGHPYLDTLYMALFGYSLGALLCFLGGLIAVDISSKKASGTAMGLIGVFSYLGAAIQDGVSGHLIDKGKNIIGNQITHDFSYVIFFWIGASFLSMFLALLVWNASSKK